MVNSEKVVEFVHLLKQNGITIIGDTNQLALIPAYTKERLNK